jgi:hypothetical protein
VQRSNTPEKRATFIAELRVRGTVYHAAKAADIGRRTAYAWRERYAEFARDWDDALEDSTEILEQSLYQRALDADTTAAIFLLKARRPEVYREKPPVAIDANAAGGVQIYLPERKDA